MKWVNHMEVLLNILHSHIFRRFVMAPLAVIGFYQILRGVATIIEKDISEQDWIDGWILVVYIAATVLGCICLVVAL